MSDIFMRVILRESTSIFVSDVDHKLKKQFNTVLNLFVFQQKNLIQFKPIKDIQKLRFIQVFLYTL